MIERIRYGGVSNPYNYSEFTCDTAADIADLPTNKDIGKYKNLNTCSIGSKATVISDRTMYILNGNNQWVLLKDYKATGGGSSILIDETLTESGQAADAKAVGDKIAEVKESAHTHSNKDVLDGITSNKITAWDGYSTEIQTVKDDLVGKKDSSSEGSTGEIFNSYEDDYKNKASGKYSHAEGIFTKATKKASHAEGQETVASGDYSHAEGDKTTASGISSHAEGFGAFASGNYSHAESNGRATGELSHAEGGSTTSSGDCSHAEGQETVASGDCSHAEGQGTIATGNHQHVSGKYNVEDTENKYAFIIGGGNKTGTSGNEKINRTNIFAIGWDGKVYDSGLMRDGISIGTIPGFTGARGSVGEIFNDYKNNIALAPYSHAEGQSCQAVAIGAHAEGQSCTVGNGTGGHAEGISTLVLSKAGHAEGQGTYVHTECQHSQGKFNIKETDHAFVIGNGTDDNNRSNAFSVDWNGKIYVNNATEGVDVSALATMIDELQSQLSRKTIQFRHGKGTFTATANGTNITWQYGGQQVQGNSCTFDVKSDNGMIVLKCDSINSFTAEKNTAIKIDLSDLDGKITNTLSLYSSPNITGDLSDLGGKITDTLSLYSCTNITGDLSDLGGKITNTLNLGGCTNITGDLSDLGGKITNTLSLYSCTNITGVYSGTKYPKTFSVSKTAIASADMDANLINFAASGVKSGTFAASAMKRTAASDNAVATLVANGWTVSGLTKEG